MSPHGPNRMCSHRQRGINSNGWESSFMPTHSCSHLFTVHLCSRDRRVRYFPPWESCSTVSHPSKDAKWFRRLKIRPNGVGMALGARILSVLCIFLWVFSTSFNKCPKDPWKLRRVFQHLSTFEIEIIH